MIPRAKTIQILLPAGDPRRIRIAELTTRIVQVIEIPRSLTADFLAAPESSQVAVYFLVGETVGVCESAEYVGQSGKARARLAARNAAEDCLEQAWPAVETKAVTTVRARARRLRCLRSPFMNREREVVFSRANRTWAPKT